MKLPGDRSPRRYGPNLHDPSPFCCAEVSLRLASIICCPIRFSELPSTLALPINFRVTCAGQIGLRNRSAQSEEGRAGLFSNTHRLPAKADHSQRAEILPIFLVDQCGIARGADIRKCPDCAFVPQGPARHGAQGV